MGQSEVSLGVSALVVDADEWRAVVMTLIDIPTLNSNPRMCPWTTLLHWSQPLLLQKVRA